MSPELQCAVIGVGHLGQYHAEKYDQLGNCSLFAVVDIASKRSRAIAQRHNTQGLENYSELFGKVNAVSIATPPDTHFRITHDCLSAGIHVLVEKPIATTVDDANELVVLAQKKNCLLQVGHVEQFNPAFCCLHENIVSPLFIEAIRLMPHNKRKVEIDVILDLMIHDLGNVFSLVNSPVASLYAKGAAVLSEGTDIANVRMHFTNGCVANVTASRISMKQERKLRLFEHNRYYRIDTIENYYKEVFRSEEKGGEPFQSKTQRYPNADPLRNEIAHYVSCILTHNPPRVDGRAGYEALKAALEISELIANDQQSTVCQ